MDPTDEERVLARAVARGLISASDLARVDVASGSRVAWLVQRGLLRDDEIAELRDDPAQDDDPPALPMLPGRYHLEQRVGAGGAGVVYRAHDRELDRVVAIKVLHATTRDALARSLAEARLQARVQHHGVCQVYEAGEVGGHAFIAMQYIEGPTARAAAAELSTEQIVTVVRDVARALHAAHASGLIHRDVKPANIVVTRDDGTLHPYVLDFGVARALGGDTATSTASVVGTPAYMAPEQVTGGRIDRRTDVYGLGATLYELLAGEPPFEGDSASVLARIRDHDPVPPRRRAPTVPIDLETIVLVCLDKDPNRRYASAAALAEDLDRYLRGETITARRAGWGRRLQRFVGRHRAASLLAVLLVTTLAVAGGWGLREREEARRRAERAAWFAREAAEIEAQLRLAHLAPLHDVRAERAAVRTRLRAIETALATLGASDRAPGLLALGVGHFALGELEPARAALQRAWDDGLRSGEASLALGRTLAAIHQRELAAAAAIEDERARAARLTALEAELARPAERVLAVAGTQWNASPALISAARLLEAGDLTAAIAHARDAAQNPWLYEAHVIEGRAWQRLGVRQDGEGKGADARTSFEKARASFAAASVVARSHPDVHAEHCTAVRWLYETRITRLGERPPDDEIAAAVAPCNDALVADPEGTLAVIEKAHLLLLRAESAAAGGGDPLAHYGAARELLEAAIVPDDREVLEVLAETLARKGLHEQRVGGDALSTLDAAVAIYTRVLDRDARAAKASTGLAIVHRARGELALRAGTDPIPALDAAIHHAERAAELEPGAHSSWNTLGRAYLARGTIELARGGEASTWAERAERAFERWLAIDADDARVLNNLGNAIYLRADAERAAGRDPRPLLQRSLEVYARTVAAQPNYAFAHGNIGGVHLLAARYEVAAGLDPTVAITAAIAAFERALVLNPRYGRAHADFAAAHELAARHALRIGATAARSLDLARRALARAREVGGASRMAERGAALAVVEARMRGRGAAAVLAAADDELAKAVAQTTTADLFAALAEVRLERAQLERSDTRTALVRGGVEAAERALAINPNHGGAREALLRLQASAQAVSP